MGGRILSQSRLMNGRERSAPFDASLTPNTSEPRWGQFFDENGVSRDAEGYSPEGTRGSSADGRDHGLANDFVPETHATSQATAVSAETSTVIAEPQQQPDANEPERLRPDPAPSSNSFRPVASEAVVLKDQDQTAAVASAKAKALNARALAMIAVAEAAEAEAMALAARIPDSCATPPVPAQAHQQDDIAREAMLTVPTIAVNARSIPGSTSVFSYDPCIFLPVIADAEVCTLMTSRQEHTNVM